MPDESTTLTDEEPLTVMGFGRTFEGGPNPGSLSLLTVDVPFIDTAFGAADQGPFSMLT